MRLYTVRDFKAQIYLKPFVSPNDVEAMRAFTLNLRNPESPLAQFPDDFAICSIGEWDERKGVVEAHSDRPVELMTARTALNMLAGEAPRA